MKLPLKERLSSSAIVIALAGILGVLGVLQYRWSREVSEAASDRMRAGLQNSMIGMRQDLYRELSGLAMAFQGDPAAKINPRDGEAYAQRLHEWTRTAAHPGLVKHVFVLQCADKAQTKLLRLNVATNQFESVDWPPELQSFEAPLQALSVAIVTREPMMERMHKHGGQRLFLHRGMGRGPWSVDLTAPALLHLEFNREAVMKGQAPQAAWTILELDPTLIQQHLLPELAQRYFGGPQGLTFDVAVVRNEDHAQILYSSNPLLAGKATGVPDAEMPLFGPIGAPVINGFGPAGEPRGPGGEMHRVEAGPGGPVRLDSLPLRAPGGDWRLVVKHRKGSLEAAVNSLFRRNLAISSGILLVLAATMTMIVIATRRAQKLARLQMEFVAGVSHELRTPLAVINSAAENIADGIVDNKQRLARYGNVIRKQTRQLTQLVEQILLFAATQNGGQQFAIKVIDPREVIDQALANTEELTQASGFEVERHVEDDVPPIRGDVMALSQCVQNLITNAVKYSGESRWIAVRASSAEHNGHKEVLIAVEDRGMGIAKGEMHRIFDPFYRSPSATAAQIHGTGIGLSLAKKIADAMCGQITVLSEPGKGSSFVLHLPAATREELHAAEAEPTTVSVQGSEQA